MVVIRTAYQMDADNVKLKIQGFMGTAIKNSTSNISWKFPEARYLTGGILSVVGGQSGDTISVQIVDVDNVLGYGAGAVLDEFVTNFFINPTVSKQLDFECQYVALIPANTYMRLVCVNTGTGTDATVYMNLYSHIPRT